MGRGEEPREGGGEEPKAASLSLPSHRASLSLSSHRASLSPSSRQAPTVSRGQPLGEPPPKGGWTYAGGTRASATQLPRERDPHKAPKLGIPPGAVSPAMCRRLSGHAILCSQGKWGRGGVPIVFTYTLLVGTSLPSPGVRRTFHHPGNVRVLEVKIYYFFYSSWKLSHKYQIPP